MLLIDGYTTYVETLKEDTFNCLVLIHKYMKSKLYDKDHVFYYNPQITNKEYWGKTYLILDKIVNLPPIKKKSIVFILSKENTLNEMSILYAIGKKGAIFTLKRKYKELQPIMDRLQDIFYIEVEKRVIIKKLKYLKYILT